MPRACEGENSMSKRVIEEQEPTERPETGGIVTTVKTPVSKDLDFQARLKELNGEEEPVVADEPAVVVADEPAKTDEPTDDWQKNLTPEQRKEVNALYKERKKAARELRELRQRVDQLAAQTPAKPAEARAPAKLARPVKPDATTFRGAPEEFARLEEKYEDDLYDYRKQLDEEKETEKKQQQTKVETVQRFNNQVDEFAEKTPDYEEVMDEADNEVSDLMFGAIIQEGPALGYYFATHPEESAKVARMSEADAVKAVMRVVIKLEEAAKPPKKEEPKPPKQNAPATVVKGQVAPTVVKDSSKMSFKERERAFHKRNPGMFNYEP